MRIFGLTGSIGMGKSTTAAMFRKRGVPVHDADEAVRRLYRTRAVPAIEAAFPGVAKNGIIDRDALSERVLRNPKELRRLECIVHPLVREEEERFLAAGRTAGRASVLLDIPLLFETGAADRVDTVLVVTADPETQRRRVMLRPGMSADKFTALLARQMPDAEKRGRAHVVLDTSRGFPAAERGVEAILRAFAAGR
jgi:dephospho-CoA kinase